MCDLARTHYVSAWFLAEIHTALNEPAAAIAALEQAFEERSALMIALPYNFKFDRLRGDKRFQAIQHRVGLWA